MGDLVQFPAAMERGMPANVDDALKALDNFGRLATATGWARAALVYALVGPAPGSGRRPESVKSDVMSVNDLASRGIHGLGSVTTIRKYRDAWEATGRPARLGEPVELPDDEWPPKPKQVEGGKQADPDPEPDIEPDRREQAVDMLRGPKGNITPATAAHVIRELREQEPGSERSMFTAGFIEQAITDRWGSWSAFESDRKADKTRKKQNQEENVAMWKRIRGTGD